MAYEDYGYDPMGNVTGYVDQEAEAQALLEEERKRKEEERARKENERLAKERDNLAVHKQEVTTYANGSKTITNVAEVPATANAPGRPNVRPVAPQGFQGQTDEFGGVDEAVERQRQMNQRQPEQRQQPRAPVAPVAPGTVFDRQIQAESGGRHIDPRTGQIMTSPKGALGIAQIMPATARQPGYGIAPITDEELRTPEGNMAFGQRYKEGMLRVFNGDEEKATASYNAGPGAVQKAIRMAEQRGGDYKDYLPRETQNYLQKVFGGQAQQQQQRPQQVIQGPQSQTAGAGRGMVNPERINAPVAPQQVPFQGQTNEFGGMEEQPIQQVIPGPNFEGAGAGRGQVNPEQISVPIAPSGFQGQTDEFGGMEEPRLPPRAPNSFDEFGTPVYSERQATLDTHLNAYGAGQDDPISLMRMGSSDDPSIPDWLKERSRHRAADLINEQRGLTKAKETVANMTPEQTAKAIRKKTEGGSAVAMFIYNMLGMNLHAAEEADKLGLGRETAVMGADGKPYLIKVGYNGKPLSGYNPETQKELTGDELIKVAAGATDMKNTKAHMMAEAKGSPVTKTIDGKLVNGIQVYDPVRKTFVVKYGNKTDEQPEGWTSASQNVEQQGTLLRNKLMEQLRFVAPTERAKKAAQFDQENGTNTGEQLRKEYPEFFGGASTGAKEGAPAGGGKQSTQDTGGAKEGGTQATEGTPASGAKPAGEAPSPYSKLPPAPKFQKDPGYENESPSAFKDRQEAWSKTYGKSYQTQQDNSKKAKDIFPDVAKMKDLIDKGTSAGFGAIVDKVGNFVGYSTPGAEAIAAIAPLSNRILMAVERFEGPQSDRDVTSYKEAAGRLSDPTIPAAQKQAAFNTILEILKRNAPELDWDKAMGAKQPSIKIIKREKIQ